MARAELVLLRRFACANEIPQRFVRCVGYPHRRQVARPITARELQRVATVCLDPIAGFDGHQRRRDDLARHPEPRQLPIHHVPRGAGLIAHAQVLDRSELLHQLANRFDSVGDHAQRPYLPSWFRRRDRNRFRVDIETDKSYVAHDRLLRMWLCDVWTPIHAA
jgi:hypothetical protein